MKRLLPTVMILCTTLSLMVAQTSYQSTRINGRRLHSFDPLLAEPDFRAQLTNLEAPTPNGDSYKAFLMRQKIESRKRFPIKNQSAAPKKKTTAQPRVGKGFAITRTFFNGNVVEVSGGRPNDNTLAVSNDGIVFAALNSLTWGYNLKADSTLFPKFPYDIQSLSSIAKGGSSGHYYDPKLIYDEKADRFILVFLKDNDAVNSRIIVCFSQTNNPIDGWYVYTLPGNPLDNNRWTDFPAINITDNELFITGNLIVPGEPWQIGFDGSVIWQVDKNAGYNNDSILPSQLYSQIKFQGKFTRNVHPVRGVGSSTDAQYFLSNRNFSISNDTIFVMKLEGTMDDPETELKVTMGKTTPNYGVPPNGRQQDTDPNDPTSGLQTNDARVLGAITNGDWIQFVSTTVNPETGLAAIYHGTIQNPTEENQTIKGEILGDDSLDFGYPNIAFTGNEFCDIEAMIGVNFTSPTDFPGVGTFYYGNDSAHSSFVRLKNGKSYVNRDLQSTNERWGDYFGIQSKFNEPGTVWSAGFYGLAGHGNGTWINEISSPDSNKIAVAATETGNNALCNGGLRLAASGGVPPYQYAFNGQEMTDQHTLSGLCSNDTVFYRVMDSRGCSATDTLITKNAIAANGLGTYPNPFSNEVVTVFELDRDRQVAAYIYDMKGSRVAQLLNRPAKKGRNELSFDLAPLRAGMYVLKILADEEEILSQKLIKKQ